MSIRFTLAKQNVGLIHVAITFYNVRIFYLNVDFYIIKTIIHHRHRHIFPINCTCFNQYYAFLCDIILTSTHRICAYIWYCFSPIYDHRSMPHTFFQSMFSLMRSNWWHYTSVALRSTDAGTPELWRLSSCRHADTWIQTNPVVLYQEPFRLSR